MCWLDLDKRSRSRSLAEPHELDEQHEQHALEAGGCDRFQTARCDKRLRLAADSHK